MPNYIRNRLTIRGRSAEVFAFIRGNGTDIDFNKIIPMPESLNIEDSSTGDDGMKYLYLRATSLSFQQREFKEIEKRLVAQGRFDNAIELGKKYLINIANTGHKTWYSWSAENWGTKWNALEPRIVSDICIEFDTAWSGIVKLIERLSTNFPDVVFEYKYSDEDTGCNCGAGTITNGVSSMVYPENQSREAYELAFDLRPDDAKYYHLENGNYSYIEEEESC